MNRRAVARKRPAIYQQTIYLKLFSIECHKAKSKELTLTNYNRLIQCIETTRIWDNCIKPEPSVEKYLRAGDDWFWLRFSLVEELSIMSAHRPPKVRSILTTLQKSKPGQCILPSWCLQRGNFSNNSLFHVPASKSAPIPKIISKK